jgi:hypothetical protein
LLAVQEWHLHRKRRERPLRLQWRSQRLLLMMPLFDYMKVVHFHYAEPALDRKLPPVHLQFAVSVP